jgi:class 3 adenylate cyclase
MVLGRDPSCDVPIPSQYVSRRHARIEPAGNDLLLVDLGGRNPILLNGVPIAGSARLSPGDVISIADVTIDVEDLDGVSGGTVVFDIRQPTAPLPPPPSSRPATTGGIQSVWQGQNMGPGGTLTIMFTDLEQSTSMVTELGERAAFRVINIHNTVLRDQFREFRGHEAKRIGDGFLVLFASARDAMNCAIAIQRRLDEAQREAGAPIRVRIGIHIGEVLWDENDIFGSAVNFAARVSAEAKGGEVLISALLREVMAVSGEFDFGEQREATLKGFRGTHMLTQLLWERPAEA